MELLTQLGINWQMLVAQMVNFLIVLGVLTALVYRPLLRLIDQRSERIRAAMEQVKKSEEEARKMDEHRREQLKKIDAEFGEMLKEARRKAGVLHEQMLADARAEAESIIEKGRAELARERAEALQAVQGALGKAILTLTEKLLEREFSPRDQEKALKDLSQSIPSLLK